MILSSSRDILSKHNDSSPMKRPPKKENDLNTDSLNFPSSGKSSLTVQFVDSHFVDSYYPTIENTFQKVVKYKGQEFNLDIIDTAGQVRRYRSLRAVRVNT